MSILKTIHSGRGRAALFLGALLLPLSATPAAGHIVPVSDMMRGIDMTAAQCAALPTTVWVVVSGRPFCIRYYLSNASVVDLKFLLLSLQAP